MYWSHNLQIEQRGHCHCRCHHDADECNCGWLTFFPRQYTRTILRSGRLESRVKPFGRRPNTVLSKLAAYIHPSQPKPPKRRKWQ